jgi:hypothetical protein
MMFAALMKPDVSPPGDEEAESEPTPVAHPRTRAKRTLAVTTDAPIAERDEVSMATRVACTSACVRADMSCLVKASRVTSELRKWYVYNLILRKSIHGLESNVTDLCRTARRHLQNARRGVQRETIELEDEQIGYRL